MAESNTRNPSIATTAAPAFAENPATPDPLCPVKGPCNPPSIGTETLLLGIEKVQQTNFRGRSTSDVLKDLNVETESDTKRKLNGWKEMLDTYQSNPPARLAWQEARILADRLQIGVTALQGLMSRNDYAFQKSPKRPETCYRGKVWQR